MTHYLTADSRMQPYLMFPRFLMELEIPDTAKLLYILLLDRARVSQRTPGWSDERGRIFVLYPIKELASALHRGESGGVAFRGDFQQHRGNGVLRAAAGRGGGVRAGA